MCLAERARSDFAVLNAWISSRVTRPGPGGLAGGAELRHPGQEAASEAGGEPACGGGVEVGEALLDDDGCRRNAVVRADQDLSGCRPLEGRGVAEGADLELGPLRHLGGPLADN